LAPDPSNSAKGIHRTNRLPLEHWGFSAGPDGLRLGTHAVAGLAARLGTPFYLFDEDQLRRNARRALATARQHLHGAELFYSLKTNPHPRVLEIVREEGLGAEAISGRELRAACGAGFAHDGMILNGPGKTDAELRQAMELGVLVQVESAEEAHAVCRLAGEGRVVRAGIRINPDIVDDRSLRSTRTGSRVSVFGLDPGGRGFAETVATLRQAPRVRLESLSAHIGTGIVSVEPFRALCRALLDVRRRLGASIDIRTLDLGGGFAVSSEVRYGEGVFDALEVGEPVTVPRPESIASFSEVCAAIAQELGAERPPRMALEPGRLLVSDAFHLVTRVTRLKEEGGIRFAIVDASRAQNALFVGRGFHEMIHAQRPADRVAHRYTVVGPLCAAFDVFARERGLPALAPGDVVMICDVGAYNLSAQSRWSFDPAPVVGIRGDEVVA